VQPCLPENSIKAKENAPSQLFVLNIQLFLAHFTRLCIFAADFGNAGAYARIGGGRGRPRFQASSGEITISYIEDDL
jgi:hypothetical protein